MTKPLPVHILVVAKAPVPGRAKTRLAAGVGDEFAAEVAAAALQDTLDAVSAAPVAARTVALAGDLDRACAGAAIRRQLAGFRVCDQRGATFGDRLANAHLDVGVGGAPVLQIGMDTPQITAELLADCAESLLEADGVLGPADDGGWWVLGLRDPAVAQCLRTVPMSQADTGARTLRAVRDAGVDVHLLPTLTDVDTVDDIERVRRKCLPGSRFHRATNALVSQ